MSKALIINNLHALFILHSSLYFLKLFFRFLDLKILDSTISKILHQMPVNLYLLNKMTFLWLTKKSKSIMFKDII